MKYTTLQHNFIGALLGATLLGNCYALDDYPQEHATRFIVKFKKGSISDPVKNFDKGLNFEKIIGDTFVVSSNNPANISHTIAALDQIKHDINVEFMVKDRVGYFKPVPEPQVDAQLVQEFSAFSELELGHKLQWDHFKSSGGINLESKPFLADGALLYLKDPQNIKNKTVVAVLDTGIEDNPDLSPNVVKNSDQTLFGWNFSKNDSDLSDGTGSYHGTHVAGTIAAIGPNVYGMSEHLQILPVKIPDETGMFYESNVIKGIYWAIGEQVPGTPANPYPAQVINMSFGIDEYPGKETDKCSPAVAEAISFARSKGVTLVVAAGNSNAEYDLGSPGGCQGTVRVASTGPTGLRSYFSNYGNGITLAAPGGDKRYGIHGAILSTVKPASGYKDSGLDFYQGTSMAAPHVAGLAGIIYSLNVDIKNNPVDFVEQVMTSSAHDFAESYEEEFSCKGKKSCGHGIINANNAVKAVLAKYDVIFKAPTSDFLGLTPDENCRGDLQKITKNTIIKPEGTWTVDSENLICQGKSIYKHPRLELTDKQINAIYGQVVYQLEHNYSTCEQIGYDGVGCYK